MDCILQYFHKYHSYHLSIQAKALESSQCFKLEPSHLLIKNWYFALACEKKVKGSSLRFVRLSNAFVFPVPDPGLPIINIQDG